LLVLTEAATAHVLAPVVVGERGEGVHELLVRGGFRQPAEGRAHLRLTAVLDGHAPGVCDHVVEIPATGVLLTVQLGQHLLQAQGRGVDSARERALDQLDLVRAVVTGRRRHLHNNNNNTCATNVKMEWKKNERTKKKNIVPACRTDKSQQCS
jgi:hypothetical protein